MEQAWKLAEAKNRFSEVVNKALREEPQFVNRRGEQVVIISKATYETMTGKKPSLKDLLLEGPSLEGVDTSRVQGTMRPVKL